MGEPTESALSPSLPGILGLGTEVGVPTAGQGEKRRECRGEEVVVVKATLDIEPSLCAKFCTVPSRYVISSNP